MSELPNRSPMPFGARTLVIPARLPLGLLGRAREHEAVVRAMNETLAVERERSGPTLGSAEWARAALHSATLPLATFGAIETNPLRSDGIPSGPGFTLFPAQPWPVTSVSDTDDEVQRRIRETGNTIRFIAETVMRDRARYIDRSGTAANFGSRLHALFAQAIKEADIRGVEVELSFDDAEVIRYGDPSSIRTDVVLRIGGRVVAVWDFKRGTKAVMPESRKQEIRRGVQGRYHDSSLPVEVIHLPFYFKWH